MSTTVTTQASFSATHVYTLPTVAVGDRLVLVASCLDGIASFTPATDLSAWSSFLASELNAFHCWRGYTLYIADAAMVTAWSGATVTFNSANGGKSTAVVARIEAGAAGAQGFAWDATAPSATGGDNQPNPPQLVPGWSGTSGYDDHNLWLTFATFGSAGNSATSQPQDYQNLAQGSPTGATVTAVAVRYTIAGGEDPGAFQLSGFENHQALTFAVRPLQPDLGTATPEPITSSGRRPWRWRRPTGLVVRGGPPVVAPATATPEPITSSGRRRLGRRGRVALFRSPERSSATAEPILSRARGRRRAGQGEVARAAQDQPAPAVATPQPLTSSGRRIRWRRSQGLVLHDLTERFTPIATPEPITSSTRRPRWRRPLGEVVRAPQDQPQAPATATPGPIVGWRRSRRPRGAGLVVRNPQAPAQAPAVATPQPIVTERRRRGPRGQGALFRSPERATAGPRQPITPDPRPRRARSRFRLVRAPEAPQATPAPEPILSPRRRWARAARLFLGRGRVVAGAPADPTPLGLRHEVRPAPAHEVNPVESHAVVSMAGHLVEHVVAHEVRPYQPGDTSPL